jgi:hypothetical protein
MESFSFSRAKKTTSPSVLRVLPTSDIDDNTRNISLSSSIKQQTTTYQSVSKESTTKIEVNSSIVYTQTTHTRHVQQCLLNE